MAQDNSCWYDPHRDYQFAKGTLKLRGLHSDGMTVKQLINELNRHKPEHKVIMYDPRGQIHPVTFLVKDGRNKVAII